MIIRDRATTNDAYDAVVVTLRAAGCCCILRWTGDRCVPATGCARQVDRSACYFVGTVAPAVPPPQDSAPCSDGMPLVPPPTA